MSTSRQTRRNRGTASIFTVLIMVALIAAGSLAIDAGYLLVARTHLQNASDAASLAGAAELGTIYSEIDPSTHSSYVVNTTDRTRIVGSASGTAIQNSAVGDSVMVSDTEVTVGTWDFPTSTLTATPAQPRAVSARALRTNAVNGPVGTFFAQVLGRDSFDVGATSTAALAPIGNVPEGGITIPVGISTAWFENNSCDQPIRFYPTGTLEGCAGWHTYGSTPSNAAKLRDILRGLEDDSFTPPQMATGDDAVFTGGTVASAFPDMKDLYETRRFDEAPFTEFDALVVVYDSPDCSNPSGATPIAGFASVTVQNVEEAPDKIIDAVVRCEIIHEGTGGGGEFGTLGTIPVLVN